MESVRTIVSRLFVDIQDTQPSLVYNKIYLPEKREIEAKFLSFRNGKTLRIAIKVQFMGNLYILSAFGRRFSLIS